MSCVSAWESQWQQPVQTSTSLNIHHVPMLHGANCGTQTTPGQNLPVLTDVERRQSDGVRLEALEQRVLGSCICDIIYRQGKEVSGGSVSEACFSVWTPGWCVERHRRPGPWPALNVLLPLLPRWENIHLPPRRDTPFIPTFICHVPNQLHE